MKGSGREREKASCPPVVWQALCQEPAFTLGTEETLSFLWQPPPKRTFVKRVSFNFACTKIILHILCTSLTVPIEPGPCRSAEGGRHDSHPTLTREGRASSRGQELGAPREGAGQGGSCPAPPPTARCQPPTSGSPSPHWPPAPARWPRLAAGQTAARGRHCPQEGAAGTGQSEEEPLLFCAPLSCGLTFLLTACCSFHFVVWGFFILFSREEGRKRSVCEVQ